MVLSCHWYAKELPAFIMADDITVDEPMATVVLPLIKIDALVLLFTNIVILLLDTVAVPAHAALLKSVAEITSPFTNVLLL